MRRMVPLIYRFRQNGPKNRRPRGLGGNFWVIHLPANILKLCLEHQIGTLRILKMSNSANILGNRGTPMFLCVSNLVEVRNAQVHGRPAQPES